MYQIYVYICLEHIHTQSVFSTKRFQNVFIIGLIINLDFFSDLYKSASLLEEGKEHGSDYRSESGHLGFVFNHLNPRIDKAISSYSFPDNYRNGRDNSIEP